MTDEQKKMAGLIKRLKKFAAAPRAHGELKTAEDELALATKMESRTGYHHWLLTGRVPNLRVPLLDAFLTTKGY